METMLHDWSTKAIEVDFQTYPKVNVETEKQAWKWAKDLNKSSILHWFEHSYIVPSIRHKDCSSSLWLQEYATLPCKTFDDFSRRLYAGRFITLPMMCSCRTNLKTYVCKHAVGASIHFGFYIISDPSKLENLGKRRGRPRKTGPALSR